MFIILYMPLFIWRDATIGVEAAPSRASSSRPFRRPETMSTAVARRLDDLKERGGISGREVARLLNTTPQTVSRWRQGRSSPRPGSLAKLLKLDWLLDQLGAVYESDEARLWLFSPNRDLDGDSPAEAIADDRIEEVLAIVDRLRTGAYA